VPKHKASLSRVNASPRYSDGGFPIPVCYQAACLFRPFAFVIAKRRWRRMTLSKAPFCKVALQGLGRELILETLLSRNYGWARRKKTLPFVRLIGIIIWLVFPEPSTVPQPVRNPSAAELV
jgi:hypothetical protein